MRTALCLTCRTALSPGERCDLHPRGRVVDLATTAEREKAVHAVWGPPHVRARTAASVGGVGGGLGGAFEGCGSCGDIGSIDGEILVVILVVLVAAIVAVALYYLIKWIVYAIRNYRNRPRPIGVRWSPPSPRDRRSLRGTIRDAVGTHGALTGAPCAAWGVMIEADRTTGGHIMLLDGETAGMTLALDDGRTIKIPAGRVRVSCEGTRVKPPEAYLRRVDPGYSASDETPVIPVDDAHEYRLEVGDSVSVVGGLTEAFDPNAPAGYRDAPVTLLTLSGIPTLVRGQG